MTHVFVDVSWSTHNFYRYWDKVDEIIELAGEKCIIYIWGDTCRRVNSISEVKSHHEMTVIESIATVLLALEPGIEIWIITDGAVPEENVRRAEELMLQVVPPKHVKVWLLPYNGYVNVSVASPFTKKSSYDIYSFGSSGLVNHNAGVRAITEHDYANNPQRFLDEFHEFKTAFMFEHMGIANLQTARTKILDLSKKMLATICKRQGVNVIHEKWRDAASHEEALEIVREFVHENSTRMFGAITEENIGTYPIFQQIETRIQQLNQLCETHLRAYRLPGATPLNIVQRTEEQDELDQIEEMENLDLKDGTWECPITYEDDETCCVWVNQMPWPLYPDKTSVAAVQASKFPLRAKCFSREMVKACLAYHNPLGGRAMIDAVKRGVNPFTNLPGLGALVFYNGSNLETIKKIDRCNDILIGQMVFGDRLPGNKDLWFGMLCRALEKAFMGAQQHKLAENVRMHLRRRFQTSYSNMTLTGLAIEPLVKVPVELALWYCFYCDDLGLWKGRRENRFRSIVEEDVSSLTVLRWMVEISCTRASLGPSSLKFIVFISVIKQLRHQTKIEYYLRIASVHKAVTYLGGVFYENKYRVEWAMPTEQYESLRDYNPKIPMVQMEQHRANDILPDARKSYYGYDLTKALEPLDDVVILNMYTLRPYYDPDWKQRAEERAGCPPSQQISICKYLILYMCESQTNYDLITGEDPPEGDKLNEFYKFVQRHENAKHRYILPVFEIVEDATEYYLRAYRELLLEVLPGITWEEFKNTIRESQSIERRIAMQRG